MLSKRTHTKALITTIHEKPDRKRVILFFLTGNDKDCTRVTFSRKIHTFIRKIMNDWSEEMNVWKYTEFGNFISPWKDRW